jgi:hypothetical protein
MPLSKNKLYWLLTIACLAGYIWLFISHQIRAAGSSNAIGVCLIKGLTNIPCPSCGATRSMLALVLGDFSGALYWNPIGIILFLIMVILPIWLAYDVVSRKETLLRFYHIIEITLKRRWVAIPAILLVLGNWIWNICKGL